MWCRVFVVMMHLKFKTGRVTFSPLHISCQLKWLFIYIACHRIFTSSGFIVDNSLHIVSHTTLMTLHYITMLSLSLSFSSTLVFHIVIVFDSRNYLCELLLKQMQIFKLELNRSSWEWDRTKQTWQQLKQNEIPQFGLHAQANRPFNGKGMGIKSVIHATMNEFLLEFDGFLLSLSLHFGWCTFFLYLPRDAGTSINDGEHQISSTKMT